MILVDTNVILDLVLDDAVWGDWSERRLAEAALQGPLLINAIIYAELAAGYTTIEALDEMVDGVGFRVEAIPKEALFLAGRAFGQYRRRGGAKANVLSDFFIGAHAAISGLPLLTRDRGRYQAYFPIVQLVAPDPD